jgi:hypothetical protein
VFYKDNQDNAELNLYLLLKVGDLNKITIICNVIGVFKSVDETDFSSLSEFYIETVNLNMSS